VYIISFRIYIKINSTDSTSFPLRLPAIQSELLPIFLSGKQVCPQPRIGHKSANQADCPTTKHVRSRSVTQLLRFSSVNLPIPKLITELKYSVSARELVESTLDCQSLM